MFILLAAAPGRTEEGKSLIVKLKSGMTADLVSGKSLRSGDKSLDSLLSEISFQSIKKLFTGEAVTVGLPNEYYLFQPSKAESAPALMTKLNAMPGIEWAEPNYLFKIDFAPNDSLYPQQWALRTLGMESAWNIGFGDPAIIVGVIDTGVDYLQEDLAGQLWINSAEDLNHNGRLDAGDINNIDDDGNGYVDDVIGWDFTDAPDFPDNGDYLDPDNDPMDEYPGGHGTAVSGIIAASTDNKLGIAGIAPGARIMALRAGTASGFLEEDDIAEAIVYGVQNGCRIINMSFGDVVYSHLIRDAVSYGVQHNVLFVASAGNSGNSILQFPAGYDETISVGATTRNDELASFSSFGPKIDLVAPGEDIFSTSLGDRYGEFNGTSFSAPMVSGALALIWSGNPSASSRAVQAKLLTGCTDLGAPGWDEYFGNGLLNVSRSLTVPQSTVATIASPQTQSGLRENTVAIRGTAASPDLEKYSLSYGIGADPVQMMPFLESSQQVIDDTLGLWETTHLQDAIYTLELKVTDHDRHTISNRVVVYLDRTPPVMEPLQIIPMMVENENGCLIQLNTDDQTLATLFYRLAGGAGFSHSLTSGYFSNEHTFLLTTREITGPVEFYIELRNTSGLTTREDNDNRFYSVDLKLPNTFTESFLLLEQAAGFAYVLPDTKDINGDGLPDIAGYLAGPILPEPRIGIINFDNSGLLLHAGSIAAFPRDLQDVTGDSVPDLLAGYGGTAYLFNGNGLPQFSLNPVQCPESDFWAARMGDFDNDGNPEVLAIHENQWQIYRLANPANFSVTPLQILDNPTSGENNYGTPYARFSDLDDDGKMEIIIGDYDGDLLIYERSIAGQFLLADTLSLPGIDATSRFATGDFDGDGQEELVVATQVIADYVGESSAQRQYWVLSILKSDGDNSLRLVWRQNFHGLNEQKNTFSGISTADYDGDGKDEIFFTPFPKVYYITWRNGQYQINWYYNGVNSNGVAKIADNRVLLSGDSTLIVWERQSDNQRPLAPARFRVSYADTARISLAWEAVSGATFYELLRIDPATHDSLRFSVHKSVFQDSTVTGGVLYNYRVQAIDSTYVQPASFFSLLVQVRAENPPQYLNLARCGTAQLILDFSKPLGPASFQADHFLLQPGAQKPTSVVRSQGNREILLTFLDDLAPGEHNLAVGGLVNEHNVPFAEDSMHINFTVENAMENPYLKKIEMISKRELKLSFNHPMDRTSAENTQNYKLLPDDEVMRAMLDETDPSVVHLFLTGKNRMGSLGVSYYLEFTGLKDQRGAEVPADAGNRVLIQQAVQDLENIIVYPNPYRQGSSQNEIMFGNLPDGCEIFIYTASGQRVTSLIETEHKGGVGWNLLNDAGAAVQSGVYIFVAQFQNQKKMGKFLILK